MLFCLNLFLTLLKVGNEAIILNIRDILKQVKSRESNISTQVQKRARSRTFRHQNSIDFNASLARRNLAIFVATAFKTYQINFCDLKYP